MARPMRGGATALRRLVSRDDGRVRIGAEAGPLRDGEHTILRVRRAAEKVRLERGVDALHKWFARLCGQEVEGGEETGPEVGRVRDQRDAVGLGENADLAQRR